MRNYTNRIPIGIQVERIQLMVRHLFRGLANRRQETICAPEGFASLGISRHLLLLDAYFVKITIWVVVHHREEP